MVGDSVLFKQINFDDLQTAEAQFYLK